MVKITGIFDDLNSSAVKTVKFTENTVIITYNSNTNKEYEFNCENVVEFTQTFLNCITNKESVGKLLHQSIKSGALTENK